MELGTKRDESRIVIIGDAEAQCVAPTLAAAGLKPTSYGTVNEALRKGRLRDADLVIIGPTTAGLQPPAACWRARMAGCQSRILLLLQRDDPTSATDLERAGADDTLLFTAPAHHVVRKVNLTLCRPTAWFPCVTVGDVEIDCRVGIVRVGARKVQLSCSEFAALAYVAFHGRYIVPWAELARQALVRRGCPGRAQRHLHSALDRLSEGARIIEPVHGIGCRVDPRLPIVYGPSNAVGPRPPIVHEPSNAAVDPRLPSPTRPRTDQTGRTTDLPRPGSGA